MKRQHVTRFASVAMAAALLAGQVAVASATVWTDETDYAPGSTVTISGDNSNSAGYVPGETVSVQVSGPNGYQSSCEGTADANGTWSCQVTLWESDLAVGDYSYTAAGQSSGATESGTFTDAVALRILGTDGIQHQQTGGPTPARTNEQDLGSVALGSHLVLAGTNCTTLTYNGLKVSATGIGTGTQAFSFGYATYGATDTPNDNATLDPKTTLTETSGSVTGASDFDCVGLDINSTGLTAGNTYHGTLRARGTTPAGASDGFYLFKFSVTTAPNTPPSVAFDVNQPSSATEGDSKTFAFTITDAEGGPFSFFTGFPDCGTGNTLVPLSASITGNAGTFQCTFPDGLVPAVASTVRVKVQDPGPLASNIASTYVTVNNANPVVAQPLFSSTSICQGDSVNLTGISFSDAGLNDANWGLDIDWGDGTTHYTDNAVTTQGAYASQSHPYNIPGTYTATVGVTDKDTGFGSNTSSNQVTVIPHYGLTFLQPVDGTTDGSVVNSVKFGRVVPIKIVIYDNCAESYVTDPDTLVRLRAALAPAVGGTLLDSVEQYADAGSANSDTLNFRWTDDASAPGGGFWIYNLDTKNSMQIKFESGKTYRFDATIEGVLATGATSQYALLKMVR